MQIRINSIRSRTKAMPVNAGLVANDIQFMLHQLSMPVDPRDTIKARRERAIRRAGLTPAKGFRAWYQYPVAILAHEYLSVVEAYKNHVRTLENTHRELANELQRLREANDLRERHANILAETALGRAQVDHSGFRTTVETAREK